jgi:hypothetical protein
MFIPTKSTFSSLPKLHVGCKSGERGNNFKTYEDKRVQLLKIVILKNK